MALIGRLHLLLIHFPIALVIAAAAAEVASIVSESASWRAVAVANVRAGAVFALAAAVTGWRLAHGTEMTPLLEWHRWLGTITAGATVAAALGASRAEHRSRIESSLYRVALLGAGALV